MKFRIHNGEYEDDIVIEGGTIEEIKELAKRETEKRGWKDCWSEEIKSCSLSAVGQAVEAEVHAVAFENIAKNLGLMPRTEK